MENQKSELLSFIETERQKGRPLSEVLGNLKVARSTYYRWQNPDAVKAMQSRRRRRRNPRKVTEEEKTRIDQMKTDCAIRSKPTGQFGPFRPVNSEQADRLFRSIPTGSLPTV